MGDHTPLPWHASRKGGFVSDIHNHIIAELTGNDRKVADAELIARSVNGYDGLLKALRDIIQVYDYCTADPADRGYAPLDHEISLARRFITPTERT